MGPELSQLIELQELDLEIQRIADRLAAIPAERERTESEFRGFASEFLAIKSKHEQTLADRGQLEADLATTQQHLDKFEQDKMRVTNEREYTTVLREIDAAKKHVSSLESEILKRMEEIDRLEAELKVYEPDVARRQAELDDAFAALDREMEEARARRQALEAQRAQITATVPRPLLATYERMSRARRGQALSEIRAGVCTACRMKVRPKVFSDVRRGDQMIECESCGRILYYRSESLQPTEAAATQQQGGES